MLEPFSPSHVHFLVQSCKEDVNNKWGGWGKSMGAPVSVEEWNALMSSLLITEITLELVHRFDIVHSHCSNSSRRSLSPSLHFYFLIKQIKMKLKLEAFSAQHKLYKIYGYTITLYERINSVIFIGFTWCARVCVCVCLSVRPSNWLYSILVCIKAMWLMTLFETVCVYMRVRVHRPMWTSDLWAVFNQAVENVIRQPSRAPFACKWAGPRCTLG